jgi:hypothetical protein
MLIPMIVEVSVLSDRRGVEIMANTPPLGGDSLSKHVAGCVSRASEALSGTTVEKVPSAAAVAHPEVDGDHVFMTRWRIVYRAPQEVEALNKARASVVAALRADGLPAKEAAE